MAYIITVLISALIVGVLMTSTYVKERRREKSYVKWDTCEWVEKGRLKYPLYIWILSILSLFIPFINIAVSAIFITILMCKFKENQGSEGCETIEEIYSVKFKPLNILVNFLNKKY